MLNAFAAGVAVGTLGSGMILPLAVWTVSALWGVGSFILWPQHHRPNNFTPEEIERIKELLND